VDSAGQKGHHQSDRGDRQLVIVVHETKQKMKVIISWTLMVID
jgi:hypothetical protein